jgi:hypothetical protein
LLPLALPHHLWRIHLTPPLSLLRDTVAATIILISAKNKWSLERGSVMVYI